MSLIISTKSKNVIVQPGSQFTMTWDEDGKYAQQWRTDGYTWRQFGNAKHFSTCDGQTIQKYSFKLRIESGESASSFTNAFSKEAFIHSGYPCQVLVRYVGDENVINWEYCHGNATTIEQRSKPFFRTAKSVLSEAVERKNDRPIKVYGDLIEAAGKNMKSQAVLAPRNLNQIQNAQKNARDGSKISQCGMYNAYEVGIETGFLRKYEIFPNMNICCMESGMS
jgi:hypothetical protein